jgi:uncharacterized membrane protein YccC
MTRRAVAHTAETPGGSGGVPRRPLRQLWPISWSMPAALRAVRATIVIPFLFALTFKVIGDAQMTLFAVFGGFAQLVTVTFGGARRDKAIAHLGLLLAGAAAVTIGTLASGSAWLAALVTLPVAFTIFFAGSAGSNAAAGGVPCLFAYVLPVASTGTLSVLPSRLEGWLLAAAASTLAVLVLSPRPPGDKLRSQSGHLAALLADQLAATLAGKQTPADAAAVMAAKRDLMDGFAATPYRPVGLAAADQGLAKLIHMLEWCTTLIVDLAGRHSDLRATAADGELLSASVLGLRQVANVLSGEPAHLDIEPLHVARLASAQQLNEVAADRATAVRRAEEAYYAQSIGFAVAAAMTQAAAAAGQADAAQSATTRPTWIAGLPESVPNYEGILRAASLIATDASLRSVWFRNSARGAAALAAAVAVAKVADVQHAFWVVLGTLSVLRTSATATGATALRALAGTVAGFAVGAALLVGIGVSPTVLWVAFPLAVLVAAYTPGAAPFLIGQAAFTVTIVVLFNLLEPTGWRVGLLRVEDVAIGCAVSLVVGFLFWPRGVSAVVGDNLADAFRSGASYLGDATSWVLGGTAERPERAVAVFTAGRRLDDAVRGDLTEQGSKRLGKADLWALVMEAMRLRLTAYSMASLPSRTDPHSDDSGLHTAVQRQAAELATFYDGLATEVARPSRDGPAPAPLRLPASSSADAPITGIADGAGYRPDALWVGLHLDRLEAHASAVTGPAARLASLRRRPWWR